MSVGIHCSILEMGNTSPPLHKATAEKFIIILPKSKHLENVSARKPQSTAPRKSAGFRNLSLGALPVPRSWELRGPRKGEVLSCRISLVAERLTAFSALPPSAISMFWFAGGGNGDAQLFIHSEHLFIYSKRIYWVPVMYQAPFQKCWDVVEDKPSPSPHGVYIPVSHRVRSATGEKIMLRGQTAAGRKLCYIGWVGRFSLRGNIYAVTWMRGQDRDTHRERVFKAEGRVSAKALRLRLLGEASGSQTLTGCIS